MVSSRTHNSDNAKGVVSIEDFQLPPISDERIVAGNGEFARVSRTLLEASDEIAIVDPFLDPCSQYMIPVIAEMFSAIARGKCQRVTLWGRASKLLGNLGQSENRIQVALRTAKMQAGLRPGVKVSFLLIDDAKSVNKMHARFLLSRRGCIYFDQGFQLLPRGRRTLVGPVGPDVHAQYIEIYLNRKNDFTILRSIL